MNGVVTNIQRFSLHDGPGIRTTVFFKGCNLRCAWCHNPESIAFGNEIMMSPEKCIGCGHCVKVCPTGARTRSANGKLAFDPAKCTKCGRCAAECFPGALENTSSRVTVEDVMREVRQDVSYYRTTGGGVTLSGGEVGCQPEFAAALVAACRAENVAVAVETNLDYDFGIMAEILKQCALVMFDLKLFDSAAHRKYVGAGNEQIIANVAKLDALGVPLAARTPLVPGATADVANVSAIAGFLKQFGNICRYELLNFNPLGAPKYRALGMTCGFEAARPLPDAELETLRGAARAAAPGLDVCLG